MIFSIICYTNRNNLVSSDYFFNNPDFDIITATPSSFPDDYTTKSGLICDIMDILDSLDLEVLVPIIAIGVVGAIGEEEKERVILQTGLPGAEYIRELLSSHPKRIYDVLRMKKDTFLDLCQWLKEYTALNSSWRISIEEQVAMFLWTVNYSASNRQVQERFQHSNETVSR
jgi:hypothetical protein